MIRLIRLSILIMIFSACQNEQATSITRKHFQNKTFDLYFNKGKDTLAIEFKDSTFQIFGQLGEGEIPWKIKHYEDIDFLILDNRVIGISQKNNELIKGIYIGLADSEMMFKERKPDWKMNLVEGKWIKESFNANIADSMVASKTTSAENRKFTWPPVYMINADSIKLIYGYSEYSSTYSRNNTGEFLLMELYNPKNIREEMQWEIKKIENDRMIVRKRVADTGRIKVITDTLIRKI